MIKFLIPMYPSVRFALLFLLLSENLWAWTRESTVYDIQKYLGQEPSAHELKINTNKDDIKHGESLVHLGYTVLKNNIRTPLISKYFKCTNCHNVRIEDPDLRVSDPETRLDYCYKNKIPFLQGTTFSGIVNRLSWYNGDYIKKYGEELIRPAQYNLRNAINLCARECSQGRNLEKWEIDSILSYFWSLQYKLRDLQLTDKEMDLLDAARNEKSIHRDTLNWLKTYYLSASPATFSRPPKDRKAGYGLRGDPQNGKVIFDISCLACHRSDKGVLKWPSTFSYNKRSFLFLKIFYTKKGKYSSYQAIRTGTKPPWWRKNHYMPNFTIERMSDQQIEDLRAFIVQGYK